MNEIKAHDTMSPEAQRIAIAEARGWVMRKNVSDWLAPDGMVYQNWGGFTSCHDCLNDLNACREFEIWLLKNHPDLRAVYRRILIECVGSDGHYWMATAAQRCEAFLRTINKWKNDN